VTDLIESALRDSYTPPTSTAMADLIDLLVTKVINLNSGSYGLDLAASFDLLVGCEYYKRLKTDGWLNCADAKGSYFHYTNTCPFCIIHKKEFFFHPCNKPESGQIGLATGTILCQLLQSHFNFKKLKLSVRRGREPVDALVVDEATKTLMLAEVKAAPLLTLPLKILSEVSKNGHEDLTVSPLNGNEVFISIPTREKKGFQLKDFSLGKIADFNDENWPAKALFNLLKHNEDFLDYYLKFWKESLVTYKNFERDNPFFWLTGACGQPHPRPNDWPRRRSGGGFESVSDGKTSVGMDRTDDIKKGIYQILKIATDTKPYSKTWKIKTALISNVHAIRHYEDYLSHLSNVVWANDPSKKATLASDLEKDCNVYNLFDGIIAFTEVSERDNWVKSNFKF